MCRHVYLTCTYCGTQRFLMWEECKAYWVRYQYVVIDRGNFEDRPRLGSERDAPPPCGGKLQTARSQEFPIGKCPAFPSCPSLDVYLQHKTQQHKTRRQQNSRLLTMGRGEDASLGGGSDSGSGESREDRHRREFADRWFQKLPLRTDDDDDDDNKTVASMARQELENQIIQIDGGDGDVEQDCEFRQPHEAGAADLAARNLSAPVVPALTFSDESMGQSIDSSAIESESEMESPEQWGDVQQRKRSLRIDTTSHSI